MTCLQRGPSQVPGPPAGDGDLCDVRGSCPAPVCGVRLCVSTCVCVRARARVSPPYPRSQCRASAAAVPGAPAHGPPLQAPLCLGFSKSLSRAHPPPPACPSSVNSSTLCSNPRLTSRPWPCPPAPGPGSRLPHCLGAAPPSAGPAHQGTRRGCPGPPFCAGAGPGQRRLRFLSAGGALARPGQGTCPWVPAVPSPGPAPRLALC